MEKLPNKKPRPIEGHKPAAADGFEVRLFS